MRAHNCPEDVDLVLVQGLEVDDDKNPEPESVPNIDEVAVLPEHEWGWGGIYDRKETVVYNHRQSIIGFHDLVL